MPKNTATAPSGLIAVLLVWYPSPIAFAITGCFAIVATGTGNSCLVGANDSIGPIVKVWNLELGSMD